MIPIDPAENAIPFIGSRAIGTVVQLVISDPSVNDVLAASFNRIVIERSTDDGLLWAEASKPSDRPALQSGVSVYKWSDKTGSENFLYRVRYFSPSRNEMSDPGPPVPGGGLAIANILTVQQLISRYLFGIDLTDDNGDRLTDEVFIHYILAAIRNIERWIDIPIIPTSFIERQDYHVQDLKAHLFLMLDYYPVLAIESFRVKYQAQTTLIDYPLEWLRLDRDVGHLQVVPTSGNLSQVLMNQDGLVLSSFVARQYYPSLYEVAYSAGFAEGRVPRDILDVIGMLASLGPLGIFGDLITGAGIGNLSLSMDGFSQSVTTTQSAMYGGYGSRVKQYIDSIKEEVPRIRDHYKRVAGMTVV